MTDRAEGAATTGTLRPATPADVAAMAAIEVASFSDPWTESAFGDILRMPSARTSVVTDDENMLLAYCVMIHAADQGEIANIAVAKRAHRLGLGSRLLADALEFALQQKLVAVFLEVRESNRAARALYRSCNFQEIGRRKRYYERPPEDALVLQWTGTT